MPRTEIRIFDLFTLFKQIEDGELRIPSFQRKFVWGKSQIIALLESIYKGFPIGTLLFIRSDEEIFESSKFAPDTKEQDYLSRKEYSIEIVDGAQRLRVLYNCLYVDNAREEKDTIFSVGFDLKRKQFIHLKSSVTDANIVELPSVFSSEKYPNEHIRLSKLNDGESLLNEMNRLYSAFRDYKVPAIMLSDASANDVIEIFQSLNTRGAALSKDEIAKAISKKPKRR